MNKLVITQDNSRTEYPVPNAVVTALYNIGKDDDQNLSLTEGVDTTNNNRPVSTVSGSIRVATAYAHHLLYIAVKYPNLSITADSTYIYFADPEVERVLLAAGIGDGVGISISAAANATIGTALRENTTITSFNEFGYFSRANSSPANEMFKGCTNLESIDLSNTISIANGLFLNTALTTLSIPNLQTLSGINQFNTCTKLTEVLNLGSITSIPQGAFYHCPLLTDVVLPESCTSINLDAFTGDSLLLNINLQNIAYIGKNAFYDCTGLQGAMDLRNVVSIAENAFKNTLLSGTIDLPNIQSIGNAAFERTKIKSVTNLGSVTEIPSNCFYNCKELTNIIIRPGITAIGAAAFLSTNLSNIILPHGFETFGKGGTPIKGSCNNITYMQFPSTITKINFWDVYRDGNPVTAFCVVLATTPPDTGRKPDNAVGNGKGWSWGRPQLSRWYVPDSVVNVYKENEQWSPIADYIFPISQLETDSPVNWLLYQTNKDYGVS